MNALDITQQQRIHQVIQQTAKYRKRLLKVRASDRRLSFFRMQAETHTRELIIKQVTGEDLGGEAREFLDSWLRGSDVECEEAQYALQDYVNAIEQATGNPLQI